MRNCLDQYVNLDPPSNITDSIVPSEDLICKEEKPDIIIRYVGCQYVDPEDVNYKCENFKSFVFGNDKIKKMYICMEHLLYSSDSSQSEEEGNVKNTDDRLPYDIDCTIRYCSYYDEYGNYCKKTDISGIDYGMPIERWFCYNHQMMHVMEEESNNSNKNGAYLYGRLPRILCPSSNLSSYSEEHKAFRALSSNGESNQGNQGNQGNQSNESVYSEKSIAFSLLKGLNNDVIMRLKEVYNKRGDSKLGKIHIYATLPPGSNRKNSASKSTKSKLASWKSGGKVYYKIGTSMDIKSSNWGKLIECPVFKSCRKSDSPLNVNYLLTIQCNDIYKLKELIKLHLEQKLVHFGKGSKNICKGCESDHEDWFLIDRSTYFKLLTEGFVALKDFYPGWKNIKNIIFKWSDHINNG